MKKTYSHNSNIKNNWKKAWNNLAYKIQLIITSVILIAIAIYIDDYFSYIQFRPGYIINDLLLKWIPVYDMSLYIFSIIYLILILIVINLSSTPLIFLKCLQAYTILTLLRILAMYLLPLEEVPSYSTLNDPFIGYFFYGNTYISKDLFFSGHISTISLFFFFAQNKILKFTIIISVIVLSILILIQHAHYTIDVAFAPLFSWISYKLSSKIPMPAIT